MVPLHLESLSHQRQQHFRPFVTSAFKVVNTLFIVSTSLKAGTLTNLLGLSEANKDAVNIGNTAFLAPSTFNFTR